MTEKLTPNTPQQPAATPQAVAEAGSADDVRGFNEDGEYGPTITVPNVDAVAATFRLGLPEFERTSSFGDAVIDGGPGLETGITVQFERNP
jgi:hypothetical protein